MTVGDVYRSRSILAVTQNESIVSSTTTANRVNNNIKTNYGQKICTKAAILELPSDGLTRDERKSGWILIHLALACYCFWFLASICDDYFVPAIQSICSGKIFISAEEWEFLSMLLLHRFQLE